MLQRYLLRETLSLYLLGVLLFVGLITFDLLSSISGVLLRQKTSLLDILMLVVYRLPNTLYQALALGLVFAVLVTLARWVRQSELKAVYAAGIRPGSLVWPVLGVGLLVSALILVNLGWVRPIAQERFDNLWYRVSSGSEPSGVLTEQTYAPQGLGVYYAQRIYPVQKGSAGSQLEGIRVVEPDGSVWSADQGEWVDGAWRLKNAFRVAPTGKVSQESDYPLPFPRGVQPKTTSYDALKLPELHQVARIDPQARFWLTRRYADATGALILAWLAVVIGLSLRESSWAFVSIVALIFGYWSLWTFSAKIAQFDLFGGMGAWLANLVYFGLALVGTWRLR